MLAFGQFIFVIVEKCLGEIARRMKLPLSESSTFLVHQSVPKHQQTHQYESVKAPNLELPLSQALHPCLSGTSIIVQMLDVQPTDAEKCFTTVDDYLQ